MMINFRLNKKSDNELISLLNKDKNNNNMSEFIRGVLRDSLLTSKSVVDVEDVFADDTDNKFTTTSNTDNVVEIRQVNNNTEINNTNSTNSNCNKKESIKWNFPS